MNFDLNGFLKLFGSLSKLAWIVFFSGLILIMSSNDFREKFYLEEFVTNYGVWIGISTLIAGILIVIDVLDKIFSYFKRNKKASQTQSRLLRTLKNLGIEEKKILAYFLSQQKQTVVFKFQYVAAIPDSIGHLQQMGFLYEVSNEYGTYYYQVVDEIWAILEDHWQEVFYEDEFKSKVN
ncbi:super-infection exclusion protein B [Sulfurovum sp.]|uniref:super-infection exclusion protein B n=1 Tax=Sulfurovum sp. TaxID=1969726 RepID=UPI003562D8C7